jgi:lipopolysaccharide transport system permease protein
VLSALGVFVRDIGQAVTVILPLLFFLSPIIYPIEAVPPQFRFVTALNPIAHVVEDCRRVAIFGLQPDWRWFLRTLVFGGVVAFGGFLVFMKSKRAFHDAL